MATINYKDIVTRYFGHPKYNSTKIIEDNIIEVIIQKLEMILFTRKGEVLGQPDLGCDLEFYLWKTKVPANKIKGVIHEQIGLFIPELNILDYTLEIELYQGTIAGMDIMHVNFIIKDYNVNFIFQ